MDTAEYRYASVARTVFWVAVLGLVVFVLFM